MRDFLLNIIFCAIGVIATVLYFRSCSPVKTETKLLHDTVTEIVHFPIYTGETKSVIKYTYGGMLHDTITERIYITTEKHDTITAFTAVLDTIQNRDTLHLEFNYPSAMFKYSLSRQPLEYRYVNTTTEKITVIQPPKLTFGVQVGFGYLVSWRTGQSAIGNYVGFGANYKL